MSAGRIEKQVDEGLDGGSDGVRVPAPHEEQAGCAGLLDGREHSLVPVAHALAADVQAAKRVCRQSVHTRLEEEEVWLELHGTLDGLVHKG